MDSFTRVKICIHSVLTIPAYIRGESARNDLTVFIIDVKYFLNSIPQFSKLLFSYRRVSNFLVLISINFESFTGIYNEELSAQGN